MSLEIIFLLIASAVALLLGATILARTYQRIFSWFFIVAITGLVTWAIGDAIVLSADSEALVSVGAVMFYVGPMAIPVFMWLFSLSFPERRLDKRSFISGVGAFFLAALAILIWPQGLYKNILIQDQGLNLIEINAVGFWIYAVYFSIMFSVTYLTLIRLYTSQHNAVLRTQILYVLFGLVLASVPALFTNLALPLMGNARLVWLGPIFSTIFVIFVSISIIRHRLFDIQLIIARSIGYLLSVAAMAVVFSFVGITAVNALFFQESSLSIYQQVAYVVMAIIIAIVYPSLKKFFDKITNSIFYRDNYEPQAFIESINRALISNVDASLLLKDATKVIDSNIKSTFSSVLLNKTEYMDQRTIGTRQFGFTAHQLKVLDESFAEYESGIVVTDDIIESNRALYEMLVADNVAVVAKLASTAGSNNDIGYLLIGTKKSGNSYGKKDVNIIRIIANELVIAIQNSLRFEEIENFNVTLQEKVNDATRKLQRANEKLKALDETKDEFISMASHQLRTPLTSVKGYVSMVLEGDAGKLNDMQRKLLEQSFASSQRMVYLIADLLNLSRLRTGKFVIESKPTNLADVIESEVEQLTASAAGRGLTLTYDKPKDFPTLLMDETKIRQVVMNFSDNAIYYTPSGGKIEIKLTEDKNSIEFTVNDNGIGIPVGEQHKLFGKFFRAKNAQKARPDGTGLGLFMAKKVIVAQGGALVFKSTEGKGSTFGFTFSKNKLKLPLETTPKP